MPFYHRSARGFTFLEIMFVVVIIGVLIALVVPNLVKYGDRARVTATQASIRSTDMAVKTFELDTGRLPKKPDDMAVANSEVKGYGGPYFEDGVLPADAWQQPINYRNPAERSQKRYDVWSDGKDGVSKTTDDIGNWQTAKAD